MKKNAITNTFLFFLTFGLSITMIAQNYNTSDHFVNVKTDEKTQTIKFVRLADHYELSYETGVDRLFEEIFNLREEDELELYSVEEDKFGMTHYRYLQKWEGYPVEGGVYYIHTRGNQIVSANGSYYPRINIKSTPSIQERQALKIAIQEVGAKQYKWEVTSGTEPTGKLVILPGKEVDYILCWKFDIYAINPLSRDYVFINAHSGATELIRSRLMSIDVKDTVNTKYSGTRVITSEAFNGSYRLRESGRGNGIMTYNMQNSTNHNQAVDFHSNSSSWDSLSTIDQYALDAHYAAEMFYDYNYLVQGRNSLDNNGFALKSYVHYDNDMTNAFWDGNGASFGDGSGKFSPLVSINIVSHEFTHGLTEHTAALAQSGESQALNESFSDIVAVMVEKYAHPLEPDSLLFLIGEKVTNGGIRNLADPKSKNQADTYKGTNWSASDPYACGAVQGHWFYLLASGGSGVNDNQDTFNLTGIGFNNAADIAYRTLTVYLTPNSDFADARYYSIQAAKDIFGGCSKELKQTTNAWYAVGVGDVWNDSLVANFTWEKVPCSNPTAIEFSNLSTGMASCSWDFGDGNSDTLISPVHEYTADGSYLPAISVVGCDGSLDQMTLSKPIIIDNSSFCDSSNIPANNTVVTNSCEGVVFDSGGKDSNYIPNNTGSITLQGNPNDIIKLDFLQFDLGPFTDQVQIFDGPTTASPLIHTFNFMDAPDGPIYSSGDAITIQESYDTFMEAGGFQIYYKCQSTTGIDDNRKALQTTMYPNPASDVVHFKGFFDQARIEVYSITGKKMITEEDIKGSKISINTSDLSPGLYFVKMWNREVTDTFKLIIY